MKRPFPTQCSLKLEVYATRDAMGKAAAQDGAAAVKETINKNGKAVVVFLPQRLRKTNFWRTLPKSGGLTGLK